MKLLKSAVYLWMLLHATNLTAQQLHIRGFYLTNIPVIIVRMDNIQGGIEYIGADKRKNIALNYSYTNVAGGFTGAEGKYYTLAARYCYFTSKVRRNPIFFALLPFYRFSSVLTHYHGYEPELMGTEDVLFKDNMLGLTTIPFGKKFKLIGPLNLETSLGWQFIIEKGRIEFYTDEGIKAKTRYFSPKFRTIPYINMVFTLDVLNLKQMLK